MLTIILYASAILGLLLSYIKNKKKTKMALMKSWKSFENILPSFLSVILMIGMMLSIFDEQAITQLIGSDSGFWGILMAGMIGSITLIPGFVAFPLASALLTHGAGVSQIACFVSTLMMVGVLTMPLEMKIFGKKVCILRNLAALFFSFIVAILMGVIL